MEHINLEFFYTLEREGKKSVLDFCVKMGFIAGFYECPECKEPMKLRPCKSQYQDGFAWFCYHQRSHIKRSVRSGSWFQESRLSFIQMLMLAYLWVKRTNSTWIADELKMSMNTVCQWMAFFRKVCTNAIKKEGIFMGGPNVIVEIDAKSFSGIKNNQGEETWVFAGVDRSTKKCFLEIIESGEEDEILGILKKYVLPETIIISDNWRGFDCLESNGYLHQKVSKCFGYKDPITGAHKNNILFLWQIVKKYVSTRICNDLFYTHLGEIMWRRLHKEKTQGLLMLFFKCLRQIFSPRVRDDPTYVSRKVVKENMRKENCTEMTSSMSLNNKDGTEIQEPMLKEKETELNITSGENNEREMTSSMNLNDEDVIQEPVLKEKEITSSMSLNDEDGTEIQEPVLKEKETELNISNGENNERATKLKRNMEDNNEEPGESTCDMQTFDNQLFEEIEVSLLHSEETLSADESEEENGSQNKRQKTMESLDT